MLSDWIRTSAGTAGLIAMSMVAMYLATLIFTRVAGLRSFAEMSAFDFAMSVAVGTLIATTALTRKPTLLEGLTALATLFAAQAVIGFGRRYTRLSQIVDNEPMLLMVGEEVLGDHLRKARITQSDLRAKLREANVRQPGEVLAVVLETTGDVSVLHRGADDIELDPWLLDGVRGSERLPASVDATAS